MMPTYVVWELRDLDPLGGRGAVHESRGLRLEAENIKACADQVRRHRTYLKRGVKEFVIVEHGHRIPPGGGPLNFHGHSGESLAINEKTVLSLNGAKISN